MPYRALSSEQRRDLTSALDRDRLLTLTRLIKAIAEHELRPEVDARHKQRMKFSNNRFKLLLTKIQVSRKINDLGKAITNTRKFPLDAIVDRADTLVEYDFLDADAVDRASSSVAGTGTDPDSS